MVGFINLFPVRPLVFEALFSGRMNDHDLRVADVEDIHAPSALPMEMFLSCILVEPAYRNRGLAYTLLQAAAAQYLPYAACCHRVLMDTVTPAGAAFAERCGFAPLGASLHASRLYLQHFAALLSTLGF